MIFLPFVRDTSWNACRDNSGTRTQRIADSRLLLPFTQRPVGLSVWLPRPAVFLGSPALSNQPVIGFSWIPGRSWFFTPATWLFILCTWRNAVSWLTLKEMRFLDSLLKFHELGFVLDGEGCGISAKNAHLESSIKFQLKFQYKAKLESAWIEIVDEIDVIFSPECSWQKRTLLTERGDVSLQSASCSPGILYFCVS